MRDLFVSNAVAVLVLAATVGTTLAATPCDALRRRALQLEAQHPETTVDTGDGRFLAAVLGPQPEKHADGLDGNCDSLRAWLKKSGLDEGVVDSLEADPIACDTVFTLYDHRKDGGGFIALSGTEGSAHAPVAVVLDFDQGRLRVGWTWEGAPWPESFDLVEIRGQLYPAMFTPKLRDTDLAYRIELIAVNQPTDAPLCSLSITYKPEFLVGDWFGPKGENDVDPQLRRAVTPIVSALAAGRDVRELVKPWLDHAEGDSPYDDAIRGYPDRTIDGLRFPNTGDHVYSLPWGVPFLTGQYGDGYYTSAYGGISGADPIPLVIHGRRVLLLFGYAWSPGLPPPEAGFGLYEYNEQKRDFDPVAGGIMMRRGRNPTIE
jgi:hypothetical protein